MELYTKQQIQRISIHVGLKIRLKRLESGLSQHDISIQTDTSSTAIGRIERAEHGNSWQQVMIISQILGLEFSELFELKPDEELIQILDTCYSYEKKLTTQKKAYYDNLRKMLSGD